MLYKMCDIDIEDIILPNTPLANIDIDNAVKQLDIPNFRGCYLINMLPKLPHRVETSILNLDDSQGNGTHWTAWFADNCKQIYFDSYSLQPPTEIVRYLRSR